MGTSLATPINLSQHNSPIARAVGAETGSADPQQAPYASLAAQLTRQLNPGNKRVNNEKQTARSYLFLGTTLFSALTQRSTKALNFCKESQERDDDTDHKRCTYQARDSCRIRPAHAHVLHGAPLAQRKQTEIAQ